MPIVFLIVKALRIAAHTQLPHIFHGGVCRILGIRIQRSGDMSSTKPTLFASNHISYIDVFVLGNIPAYFIAKSEVAGWPILGQLAKFQNTLFIERKVGKTRAQLEILQSHLQCANNLILFPEGTSTNGTHVEPFKSSLFEAANSSGLTKRVAIQPVTICYTHHAGERISDQSVLDRYAWYAKMPFAPHFFGLFPLKSVDVNVHFHPVCYLEDFESRKQCADHCQKLVAEKMAELLD